MRYPNNLYVILFLIISTAIFVIIKADSPKIRARNLSFIMASLGVNLLTIPVALFIGGMATDSPYSTELDFWGGFFFIQGIPVLMLLVALIWWFIRKIKEKIDT
ncbi:hypothetical protein CN941_30760 [Bacillus cereus]|uniref:Group-specific protein n=1 Tax=Bacillus cereus TaxID=1396 RepID=A0A2B1CPE4_BACCE|nr:MULTISPECIES: hypothetical protein [Bacillus cereus group]PDY82944.1 hypothetical protein CON06_09405 [Bacillus cereus]PEU05280.1 hypothetical protein CN527_02130 [Bacillus cereus]PFA02448.1 hypothetical protein CN382_30245 [Bacillus cereus]PFA32051.1 hypothetical protein CN390_17060 [Bacillus cereus]PFE66662.1 hypothetical protein CN316_21560 [Bacillus cereus]